MRVFIRLNCALFALTVVALVTAAFTVRAKMNVTRSQAFDQAQSIAIADLAEARAKLAHTRRDLAQDLERATQSADSSSGASAFVSTTATSSEGDVVTELTSPRT